MAKLSLSLQEFTLMHYFSTDLSHTVVHYLVNLLKLVVILFTNYDLFSCLQTMIYFHQSPYVTVP